MYVNVACVYAYHMCIGVIRDQTRASDPLELGLQVLVAAVWVLGIECRSSARSASVLN